MASAFVVRSMIPPGGMMSPPTSRAERVIFTQFAGAIIPVAKANIETKPKAPI